MIWQMMTRGDGWLSNVLTVIYSTNTWGVAEVVVE